MNDSSPQSRETIAMNAFPDAKTSAERIFRSMNPDEILPEIERQLVDVLVGYGLSVQDPQHLYHAERPMNRLVWPEHIHAAVQAYYAFLQAKRCINNNDAKWTAYQMLNVAKYVSLYNLLAFEHQITLGDCLVVARREGGLASGEVRRQTANEKADKLAEQARRLLADGKSERALVGILKQRLENAGESYSETSIRNVLKSKGILTGRKADSAESDD